jgi:hypothetical protein
MLQLLDPHEVKASLGSGGARQFLSDDLSRYDFWPPRVERDDDELKLVNIGPALESRRVLLEIAGLLRQPIDGGDDVLV